MTVVQDVLARFRADTSELEQAIPRANAKLADLHDTAAGGNGPPLRWHFDDAGDGVDGFAKRAAEGGAAIDELGKKAETLGITMRNMFIPIIGAAGLGGLIDMAQRATAEFQTLSVQFNATFGKTSGSSALQSAIEDANKFGVSIAAAAVAYQSFGQATKGTNQNMKSDMKDFADIAAGTGQSIDAVSASIGNYYQLIQRVGGSGGQASRYATTLLTSHIIDPQTYNQLRLLANQGANPQQLLDTILNNGESQYGGAGAAQANTLSGQIQTFKNQFSETSRGAFSPIMNDLQGGLKTLNKDLASPQFKQATDDVISFVAAMAHGVTVLEPFAKTIAETVLAVAHLATEFRPLAEVLGTVVAALLAWQGVKIVTNLLDLRSSVGDLTSKETGLLAQMTAVTDAMNQQTAAAERLVQVLAQANGITLPGGGGGGVVPVAGNTAVGGMSDSEHGSMMTKSMGWLRSNASTIAPIVGMVTLAGSQYLGNAVGGSNGSAISTIGGMTGMGAMVGSIIPAVGPLLGGGIGAAAGLVVNAFQQSANAANAQATAVQRSTDAWEKAHPLNPGQPGGMPTAQGIDTNFIDARNQLKNSYEQFIRDNYPNGGSRGTGPRSGGTAGISIPQNPTPEEMIRFMQNPNTALASTQQQAMEKAFQGAAGMRFNEQQNLTQIASQGGGMTTEQARQFAQQNNIDLSQNYRNNAEAIDTATAALRKMGGAAEMSAEQISSSYNLIAARVSGSYGELQNGATPASLIETAGKSANLNGPQSIAQFFNLAGQAGVDLKTMGITPQSLSATSVNLPGGGSTAIISPQEAQLKNQMLDTTLQYTQALQGEQEAAFGVGQAQFALNQAYFQAGQAVFALGQATFQLGQAEFAAQQATIQLAEAQFQLGRAQLANVVAQTTQKDATAATTTALTSGYLPANANVAASLAQVTSLTQQQIDAINAEVTNYNSLEYAMYGAANGADSLWATYTKLQGAVQELQAQTQQYQQLLNQPLAGTKAYSAQQEQYTVQEAAIQQQIAQLELAQVPTQDPRIQALQSQLQKIQVEAQLGQAINTQTIGQQQFNIGQAQLGPEQSYQTQLQAAQAMGQLNAQILKAQQTLDPVNAQFVALNTQLSIAQQKNQAVTGALQAQASADQGAITASNTLFTSTNAVTSANNGLIAANNGVITAANGAKVAQNNVATANNAVQAAAFSLQTQLWNQQAATVAAEKATNNFAAQLPQNIATAMQQIQGFVTSIGATANAGFQAINQALVINQELTQAQLDGNAMLQGAYQSLQTAMANNEKLTPALISELTGGNVNPNTLLPQAQSGGVVGAGGAVNVHPGETIIPAGGYGPQPQSPQQIYNQALAMGGDQIQAMVAASLANGIESGIGGGYGMPQSQELAGGIGPAQGLFQFEPQTWLGAGGGRFSQTAGGTSWQNQVQVFLWDSAGNSFGAWGPDFGYGYGGNAWPPARGSAVANMIDQLFGMNFGSGGWVPETGFATVHAGEFVLSNNMLNQLASGGNAASSGGGVKVTIGQGAIQVDVQVTASNDGISATLQSEIAASINDALEELAMQWNGV